MAVIYATDNGVEVIEGADGGLYHSAFAEAASKYAYDHGVAQTVLGRRPQHRQPQLPGALRPHQADAGDRAGHGRARPEPAQPERRPGHPRQLMPILGAAGAGTMAPLKTYFRGANTTQFGGKSSISMEGATGSTNTGKAAGAAALVIAAAREQRRSRCSADETRGILEQTAEDVLPGNTGGTGTPDPAQPGFDTHFGYGRVNLGAAVAAARPGTTRREASIGSPDWYAPLTGPSVDDHGPGARAPRHRAAASPGARVRRRARADARGRRCAAARRARP